MALSDEILSEMRKRKGGKSTPAPEEEGGDAEDQADGGADDAEEGDYAGDEGEALKEMGEALDDRDYKAAGDAFRNALRICVPKILEELKK